MYVRFIQDLLVPEEKADIVIFGALVGKHSKSIENLRKESFFIEPFDLNKRFNIFDKLKVADIGNIELKTLDDITKKVKHILEKSKVPVMLSGGHVASYFSIKGFDEDVKVVVFDAHCDSRNKYEDEYMEEASYVKGIKYDPKLNPVTWFRRSSESRNPKNYFTIGIREGDEFELDYLEKNGVQFFTAQRMKENFDELKRKLKEFVQGSKVYISVDIDGFDPAFAPAVYHPEPGGFSYLDFAELMSVFKGSKIVGFDVVELKSIPNNNVTEFLATRVIFEILKYIATNK
ncbi:MAG: arginase family protein [Candidatus Aenigmarchaeota archaeon]|nr:arginase family protein [Candidatus Aenigmarchaeota archaeon]